MTIEKTDLQLTREGYFRLMTAEKKRGIGLKQAYDKIDELCSQSGCANCYSSYESFKAAYYGQGMHKKQK